MHPTRSGSPWGLTAPENTQLRVPIGRVQFVVGPRRLPAQTRTLGLTFEQPVTGFHVASVHSIALRSPT